jgi:subtilisin family serine protease
MLFKICFILKTFDGLIFWFEKIRPHFESAYLKERNMQQGRFTAVFAATSVVLSALMLASTASAGTVLRFGRGAMDPAAQAWTFSAADQSVVTDYVVQFEKSVTEADKAALKSAGISVFRYIPDDALIVRASLAGLHAVKGLSPIHAAIPYRGWMKLNERLPTLSIFSTGRTTQVLVSAFTDADAQNILSHIPQSVRVIQASGRMMALQIPEAAIQTLSVMTGVEYVQPLDPVQVLDMKLDATETPPTQPEPNGDYKDIDGYETGTKVMNFDAIWAQGYHGENQIVAMADTGVDLGSMDTVTEDLRPAIKAGDVFGIGAKTWEDPMGHGTHVAGSVLGRGTASGGILKGGAYQAGLVVESLWSPIIDNLTVPPQMGKLFQTAYDQGARVHTNSWGSAQVVGEYDSMAQQVDDFMFSHPDFLIVFAAGNSGADLNKDGRIDPGSVGTPGTAKDALTVGASENLVSNPTSLQKTVNQFRQAKDEWPAEPIWSSKISDNINGVAMFSSRGPTKDGRLKPEIVAPGTNILSIRSHQPEAETLWGPYNKDYVWSGGTSMATPLTAGAATVTRQVLVEKFKIADPSAALVKATMLHTAKDMYPGQYGEGTPTQELLTRRPNSDEGYGRVDMARLSQLTSSTLMVDSAGVGQDETSDQTIQVSGSGLLVNLVYTDAPGTPSAGPALVNDLGLTVTGPDGKVYSADDHINNNEVLELSGLTAGTYKITVTGTKVPMGQNGKQPFALVATPL